jgi:hypothetical protein
MFITSNILVGFTKKVSTFILAYDFFQKLNSSFLSLQVPFQWCIKMIVVQATLAHQGHVASTNLNNQTSKP